MKHLLSLSIRTQLLILFVLMMVGPMGIVIFSSFKQREYQENEAKDRTRQLVSHVNSELSSFVASTELLLTTLSKISIVQQQNSPAVDALLTSIVKQNPVYSNLLLLDKSGKLLASALPFKEPVSYSERRHVKNALLSGLFSSSEYSMGKLIRKPIFAFALPLKDDAGQCTGFAIAALDLDNFKKILKGLKSENGTTILLVDHKGTILFNALYPDLIGKQDRPDLFKRMTDGSDQGTFEATGNIGSYRIISYQKLKLTHESTPYMYVRASIDRNKALESANRDMLNNIIMLTSLLLLMLGCAFYFSKKFLIDKIDALQNASQRLAKGDLNTRVAEKVCGGELGELGQAFDTMAQALSVDRSARVATEKSLIESEERLLNTVLSSPYPAMLHAEDGKVILISNSWTEITGYRHDDIPTIADWVRQAYGKDQRDNLDKIQKLFELTQRSDDGEFRITTKNGEMRTWDFSTAPIGNLSDGCRIVISMAKDITEQKLLEEQLVQSQKMEAIGTLAGGVAHDFNNILTVIEGYGTMLQKHVKDDPKAQSMLNQILVSSHRAAEMTSQLLAFSRKQQLELKNIRLNDVIHELQKSLSRLIGENIDCRVDLPFHPLHAIADRGQLEQVIVNLAVNARDAMPSGGKLLISMKEILIDDHTIGSHDIDVRGRYGLISVSDTGCGIPTEIQKRIFDPFYTTKGVGKGTGLGLSMVYGIVKKHNGYINVYSEIGKGTAFKVYLPLTDEKQGDSCANVRVAMPRGTESILVAEDDKAILAMIKELLEEHGYTVYPASNGAEAFEVFQSNIDSIDMILTDVIMPEANGREVYERISSLKPSVPVIYMSGYPADLLTQQDVAGDCIHYLSKPINPYTLLEKIRDCLKNAL